DAGTTPADDVRCDVQERGVGVGLFERATGFEGVVDAKDLDPVELFAADAVLWPSSVRLAREDRDAIPRLRRESGGNLACVGFRTAGRPGGKSGDDEQNSHQTQSPVRRSRPSRAARAPRYCPSGNATASATPRANALIRAVRSPAARRRCSGNADAIERANAPSVGIVERPKSDCSCWCTR